MGRNVVQFVLLVPADAPVDEDYKAKAANEVQRWILAAQAWFTSELGLTFDFAFARVDSPLTMSQMNAGYPLDKCGEAGGSDAAFFWSLKAVVDAGVSTDSGRLGVVGIGFGGFAGARYTPKSKGTADAGRFLLGSWELHRGVTGEPHPCNPWPELRPGQSFGHEFLHAMGADDQGMSYYLGDALDDATKAKIRTRSRAFLHKP